MLETILNHLHNYFVLEGGIHAGTFDIVSGALPLDFLKPGQYFRIEGSVFNDGVYQYPAVLTDETFSGRISALAIPRAVLELAAEIEEYNESHPDNGMASESFAGYSYTRATDSATGGAATWATVFRSRLNAWRKLP